MLLMELLCENPVSKRSLSSPGRCYIAPHENSEPSRMFIPSGGQTIARGTFPFYIVRFGAGKNARRNGNGGKQFIEKQTVFVLL